MCCSLCCVRTFASEVNGNKDFKRGVRRLDYSDPRQARQEKSIFATSTSTRYSGNVQSAVMSTLESENGTESLEGRKQIQQRGGSVWLGFQDFNVTEADKGASPATTRTSSSFESF